MPAAGLLSVYDINVKGYAVLADEHLVETAVQKLVDGLGTSCFWQCGRTLVVNRLHPVSEDVEQRFYEGVAQTVHAVGVELQHDMAVVPVDDEAGQIVALAIHEAEGVGLGVVGEAEAAPVLESVGEFLRPEQFIRFHLPEAEHLDTGGAVVVVPCCKILVVKTIYFYNVAFGDVVVFSGDGAGEDPRVIP